MSEHKMTLKWERGGTEFSYQKYPRDHTWSFDGGHTMTVTAAPAYLGCSNISDLNRDCLEFVQTPHIPLTM